VGDDSEKVPLLHDELGISLDLSTLRRGDYDIAEQGRGFGDVKDIADTPGTIDADYALEAKAVED
jgi:hypothetical protein